MEKEKNKIKMKKPTKIIYQKKMKIKKKWKIMKLRL